MNTTTETNGSPIITAHWRDQYTTAEGWLIVDSLKNGIAGGGVIMSVYLTEKIVSQKAAHMTRKLSVCSPQLGGLKGGIKFPNSDPRAPFVYGRFLVYFHAFLCNLWVFAGDFNSSLQYQKQEEAIWIEEIFQTQLKLRHSQAALSKYFALAQNSPEVSPNVLNVLVHSQSPRYFSFREGASGYGLAAAVQFAAKNFNNKQTSTEDSLDLPRVVIYGFDEAVCSLAYYLQLKSIAVVIAIGDHSGILFSEQALPIQEILECILQKRRLVQKLESELRNISIPQNSLSDVLPEDIKETLNFTKTTLPFCRENQIEEFFKLVPKFDILCACGTASRYQLTCKVTETMLRYQTPSAIVCGTNSPFGKLIHHPVECSRYEEDIEGEVINLLSSRSIQVIPDWVANVGKNQLYNLAATMHIDVMKQGIENIILEACVSPIRSFLQNAHNLYSQRDSHHFYHACELVSKNRGRYSPSFRESYKNKSSCSIRLNNTLSILTPSQKISSIEEWKSMNGIEIEELQSLSDRISKTESPIVLGEYFPPPERVTLSMGLVVPRVVNFLISINCRYFILMNDYILKGQRRDIHPYQIRMNGEYLIHVWRAAGMDFRSVKILWLTDELQINASEYWKQLLDTAPLYHSTNSSVEWNFAECLRSASEKILTSDISHSHYHNQQHENTRKFLQSRSPEINSSIILPPLRNETTSHGVQEFFEIFIDDSPEEVRSKIEKTECPSGAEFHQAFQSEIVKNSNANFALIENRLCPLLAYFRLLITAPFIFNENEKKMVIGSFEQLKEAYIQNILNVIDLKCLLIAKINELLQAIRNYFAQNYRARISYENMQKIIQNK